MKNNIQKTVFISLFLSVLIAGHAQVKIRDTTAGGGGKEEPMNGAILELESDNKGFILPRVELNAIDEILPIKDATNMMSLEGMMIYHPFLKGFKESGYIDQGVYYNDGVQWIRLATDFQDPPLSADWPWYYMPSIAIPVTYDPLNDANNHYTVYLYEEYKRQFHTMSANTAKGLPASRIISSDSKHPEVLHVVPIATAIKYFIADYDPDLFEDVAVTEEGVLTYKIKKTATDESYMNIVFLIDASLTS